MARTVLATTFTGLTVNANLTRYFPLGQGGLFAEPTSETTIKVKYYTAGTLSGIYINVTTNNVNGTSTLKTRKNELDGGQVVSIGNSTTGQLVDATPTSTDSVSVNDFLSYSLVTGGSTGSMTIGSVITIFSASSNTMTSYVMVSPTNAFADGSNRCHALSDVPPDTNTTENRSQLKIYAANTTFQNMYCYISQNDVGSDSTFSFRDDGSSAISVTITANNTGVFENTASTSTPAANSLLNFYFSVPAVSGSHTVTARIVSIEGTSTDSTSFAVAGNSNGSTLSSGSTYFFHFIGRGGSGSTNTVFVRDIRIKSIISKAHVFLSANTCNTAGTWTLRKNNIDTTLSVSLTATTTGLFEDTSNTVSFVATDEITYYATPGGTAQSCASRSYGATYTADETSISTINGLAKSSVSTINGLAIASVGTWNGLA